LDILSLIIKDNVLDNMYGIMIVTLKLFVLVS
jgi:hypothetical protein